MTPPDPFTESLSLVYAEMEKDAPMTAAEISQDHVARTVRDAWLATSELVRLRSQDRVAAQFISAQEGDLWAIKTRIDTLIDEIRVGQNERPLPPQGLRLVRGG